MRKVNQILMATVAILLTLVLISTSVVSSVFARFTITKSAETTVELQKFGVKVTLSNDSRLDAFKKTDLEVKKGDSGSVTFSGLTMKPGDEYPDALKVKFEGKPNVDVKVTVAINVSYIISDFVIPANIINGVSSKTYFMPIGLKFGASLNGEAKIINNGVDANGKGIYCTNVEPYHNQGQMNTENNYIDYICGKISVEGCNHTTSSTVANPVDIYQTFDAGDDIVFAVTNSSNKVNELYFGFAWPFEYSNSTYPQDTLDKVGAYLAKNSSNAPISFTYTVTIEQN